MPYDPDLRPSETRGVRSRNKSKGQEGPHGGPLSAEIRKVFGKNCKEARIRKGLSQQEIAATTGIAQSRVAQIELGRVNVTLETVMRIARYVD
jgi:DNA-binding XRE family transcriptional regulator